MSHLDPRSIVVLTTLLLMVFAGVLLSMRRRLSSSINGTGVWAAGTIVIGVATVLIGQRERLPEWLTSVFANGLLWIGMSSCVIGLRRFAGRREPLLELIGTGLAYMAASAWFAVLHPDYPARLATNAFFFAVIYLVLLESVESVRPRNRPVKFLAVCFAGAIGVVLLRLLAVLAGIDKTAGLFAPNAYQKMFLVSYGLTWLFANIAFILMVNERLYKMLRRAAAYDPLSGLVNRGTVTMMLEREIERASRNGKPLSVLLVDIDHFKRINDRHGHAIGDRTIVDFATRTALHLRRADVLSRYGGEEFLALLPDTDAAMAVQVAERVRASIAAETGALAEYTVSIGVACLIRGMTPDDLVHSADQALYRAKENGRNRVEITLQEVASPIPAKSPAATR